MEQPLLTIAIPTYNRARLLDTCLNSILSQVNTEISNDIEVIVSDNDSPDNTTNIVEKYINTGHKITYTKRPENIGADRNIAACFLKASGKYVWLFSDDDLLLPGYLKFIFDLLNNNDFGNLYLNGLWYNEVYENNTEAPVKINFEKFDDPLLFIEKVNFWLTFITGNIINKSLFTEQIDVSAFYESNLGHLSWILPSVFKGKQNAIISDKVIACKENNTGGYNLLKVFGQNFNNVMDMLITRRLIDKKVKRIINQHLLNSFFPMFIYKPNGKFETENSFKIMIPIYWSYYTFWRSIFPALFQYQNVKTKNG
ncbi:glycosyltransferase family 2 protein [Mucilaginibacter sp.]|jgi:glycosyltransferase involved in cell wall biosynthesis|uniref:glycosyltransferase family 2 protein n=1 Tax=Mucilaginibacter sp. TaxID=1882438 RepID=UPI0035630935